jgi:carboxyl-terminal processing protease
LKITLRCTLLALSYLLLLVFSGCSGGSDAGPAIDSWVGFTFPSQADYRTLSWTDAFKSAHDKFSREYAFSDWKGVDWPNLYSRFLPRITQAQAVGDEKAYYLALHEYARSIPDGHIDMEGPDAMVLQVFQEQIGGDFGLAVAELDDWRVIAASIASTGPAAAAGIVAGAEIISWGGQEPKAAIGRIPFESIIQSGTHIVPGATHAPATQEHQRLEQARLLTRAPIGTNVQVVFKNPGAAAMTSVLSATDDNGQGLTLFNLAKLPSAEDRSKGVIWSILPDGYGHIYVAKEPTSDPSYSEYKQKFSDGIDAFIKAGVPGVILDLRGNRGGSDTLASELCGFFYADRSFYEHQEYYDTRTGGFLRYTMNEHNPDQPLDNGLWIEPQTLYYSGPVVALVNPNTISSGEGLTMCVQKLPQGGVVGFHGTNGSFGMVGDYNVILPGDYKIGYPIGRSVDQLGVVQLDSRNGIGGVAPNPRVPKTFENVLAFAAGTDVELQYAIRYLRGY